MNRPAVSHFPPRAHLPAVIVVQSLPMLGTTWYERGRAYWMRRAGLTILSAGILTAFTFIAGTFVHDAGPPGSPRFVGFLTAEVVISLTTCAWIFYRSWKHPRISYARDHKRSSAAAGVGVGLGVLGIASPIAGAIVMLLGFLSYGLFLATFLLSFAPELPPERLAREQLTAELEHHWFLHHDRSSHKRKRKRRR